MDQQRWIAIVDYGVGNLRSVYKALEAARSALGEVAQSAATPGGPLPVETATAGQAGYPAPEQVRVVTRPAEMAGAAGIVLPGVGAFGDAAANLRAAGFEAPLREATGAGTPLLGICVGMQLLFDESEEMGRHRGLGIIPGRVVRFAGDMAGPDGRPLKVPHIGWNQLRQIRADDPLLAGVRDGAYAYFVHSYYCAPADPSHTLTVTDYGIEYASVVRRDHVWGIQCHPEKSQDVGLRILRNFVEMVTR